MLLMFLAMFVVLLLAGAVVVYVAYPHRGEEVPGAPWLGEALKRGVDAMPVLPEQRQPPRAESISRPVDAPDETASTQR